MEIIVKMYNNSSLYLNVGKLLTQFFSIATTREVTLETWTHNVKSHFYDDEGLGKYVVLQVECLSDSLLPSGKFQNACQVHTHLREAPKVQVIVLCAT